MYRSGVIVFAIIAVAMAGCNGNAVQSSDQEEPVATEPAVNIRTIEWSALEDESQRFRLTDEVKTEDTTTQITLSLARLDKDPEHPLVTITIQWECEYTTELRQLRRVPIRIAGSRAPQMLVMTQCGDSEEFTIYSPNTWWVPDVAINRTFCSRTRDSYRIKWRTKNNVLYEIEEFAPKAMPEEEWASHPMKDGKTWVAHWVYHWDDELCIWRRDVDEHIYYDLENETMQDSLDVDSPVPFEFKEVHN